MTVTLELPTAVEEALASEAQRQGLTPAQLLADDVRNRYSNAEAALSALKSASTPQSLDELAPRVAPPPGMTAMQYIAGKWPGEESEEELLAALEAME